MDKKLELNDMLSNQFSPQVLKKVVALPLSSGGQYFTSCIQKIKVFLEEDNKESQVDLIVKMLPQKEHEIEYNSKLKFKKEIEFYTIALPEYNNIQEKNKIPKQNLFSHFYFASEEIIVLEDLHSDGYYCIHNGLLGEVHSKLVLKELARFHATGIALKYSSPKMFKEKLASVVFPALRNASNPDKDEENLEFRSEINNILISRDDLKDFSREVDSLLSKIDKTKLPIPDEPFSTLIHNDLWRGNIMFKNLSSKEEPCNVKFIDFQTVIINSPARDLVYFLFSSVEDSVLGQFPDLLKNYHLYLISYLSDLGVDSTDFTFDKLMSEVNYFGPSKFKHLLLLFKGLCSAQSGESDFEHHLRRILFLFRDRGWF